MYVIISLMDSGFLSVFTLFSRLVSLFFLFPVLFSPSPSFHNFFSFSHSLSRIISSYNILLYSSYSHNYSLLQMISIELDTYFLVSYSI
ncbi:hypothetical protein MtrunA17_Chr4g0031401 [Medicago truncatula]|uniref:Transmembrane protein n=1 Tax=Medicago truncatula TaxID=3880 RepID=A0A396I895_MEDTR|nr:hypothetical protein MtrunA17_Chr4g0031401 [Medicago truncatula]